MATISKKRTVNRASIAFVFVFWLFGSVFTNKASASCGDYLRHADPSKSVHLSEKLAPGSDSSQAPYSSCKNGRCKAAPLSSPSESSRVVVTRQQPSHLRLSSFTHACSLAGRVTNDDDLPPIEPSLDLLSPPPRAASL